MTTEGSCCTAADQLEPSLLQVRSVSHGPDSVSSAHAYSTLDKLLLVYCLTLCPCRYTLASYRAGKEPQCSGTVNCREKSEGDNRGAIVPFWRG
jgi:hypothetical protein